MNDRDIDTFQLYIDILGQKMVENAMKINPGKNKAISFKRTRVKNPLNYF
jgi:hypothetical protein